MKTHYQIPVHADVIAAIRALRVALSTHHHVKDFTYEIRVHSQIAACWNGMNVEVEAVESETEA